MKAGNLAWCLLIGFLFGATQTEGQSVASTNSLEAIPAVAGHEQELTAAIKTRLAAFSPKTDNVGNVWVTLGAGTPNRLIATSIDEPGYVVSEITDDGYLRVQRLPQTAPNSVYDSLEFAQPVWVITANGKRISGVFAGLSVHLQSGRVNGPKMNQVEELYLDIGARDAAAVHAAGVDVLDAVVLSQREMQVGSTEEAGPAVGDRFGTNVLLKLLLGVDPVKVKGTLTVAFVTQQWTGGRGLNRLLTELHPDEMVYVGRINPDPKEMSAAADLQLTGNGVLMGVGSSSSNPSGLPAEFEKWAQADNIKLTRIHSLPPRIASYAKSAGLARKLCPIRSFC